MVTLEGMNFLFEALCKHKDHYNHFPETCDELGCDFNWRECDDCILRHVEYKLGGRLDGISRDLCFAHWHCGQRK